MIIIGFLGRLALGMVGCFKQRDVSLAPHYIYMPTHKCSQCLNTGISRAESDSGSLHIFIWEISVPLTEWNCLRIKLWINENHIWELRGEELYESISSQLYLRNFAAGKRKPFAVASITAMIFFHIILHHAVLIYVFMYS